jgi:hypothetical protein
MKTVILLLACLVGMRLLTSCQSTPPPLAENPKLQETADGCRTNFLIVGIAAAMYSDDNDGRLPANWIEMKNYLETNYFGSPQLLVCPSQGSAPTNWNNFNTNMVSYQMVAPGWVRSNAESGLAVYLYCPEHHFYLMGDGSVHTNGSAKFIWPKRVTAPNTALEPL